MYPSNTTILKFVTNERMTSFRLGLLKTPTHPTDKELIGSYIWNQQMAACLYPLLQNLEVFLRNAIDNAARQAYGDFWWDNISCYRRNNYFFTNISKAKERLKKEWERQHPTTPVPRWTHDQIVAATEFSTWLYLFDNDFRKKSNQQSSSADNYLWPSLLGKVFQNWHLLNERSPKEALIKIRNSLEELKGYRNRIFHHEPTWLKAHPRMTPFLSLQTIQQKIDKIAFIYSLIHNDVISYINDSYLLQRAYNHCQLVELEVMQGILPISQKLTRGQRKVLKIPLAIMRENKPYYFLERNEILVMCKRKIK